MHSVYSSETIFLTPIIFQTLGTMEKTSLKPDPSLVSPISVSNAILTGCPALNLEIIFFFSCSRSHHTQAATNCFQLHLLNLPLKFTPPFTSSTLASVQVNHTCSSLPVSSLAPALIHFPFCCLNGLSKSCYLFPLNNVQWPLMWCFMIWSFSLFQHFPFLHPDKLFYVSQMAH